MGYGLTCVAFALPLGRNNEQRHLTLFGCRPTVMSVTVNPMIARDEKGISAFPPFHENGSQQDILLDRLPAILARIRAVCFAGVIHHDWVEKQIIRGKPPYKRCR